MKIFNICLTGNNTNVEVILEFKKQLIKLGSGIINICNEQDKVNMEIDISDLSSTCDLREEAQEVISAANNIMQYEKKRNRIIKRAVKKVLVASSNPMKAVNRKHVN